MREMASSRISVFALLARTVGAKSPFHSSTPKQTSFPLAHLIGVGIAIARDPLPRPGRGRLSLHVYLIYLAGIRSNLPEVSV